MSLSCPHKAMHQLITSQHLSGLELLLQLQQALVSGHQLLPLLHQLNHLLPLAGQLGLVVRDTTALQSTRLLVYTNIILL